MCPEQRRNFFEEMKFYISTTETEQKFHLDGRIPSLEEYWSVRMGTSAVGACLAVIEYVQITFWSRTHTVSGLPTESAGRTRRPTSHR